MKIENISQPTKRELRNATVEKYIYRILAIEEYMESHKVTRAVAEQRIDEIATRAMSWPNTQLDVN